MILVRDDDIDLRIVLKHLPFIKYRIFLDIGIVTSTHFPVRWIKKHLYMYEVCNHSHTHNFNLVDCSRAEQSEDIGKANKIIKNKIGVKPRLFIPPYGKYNDQLLEVCEDLGLSLHPSYLLREKHPEKYYSAHETDIIGKREGWYVCHTANGKPSQRRLKRNLRYLYDNKLTRIVEGKQ